jgi:hypothetical protein
VKVGLCPDFPCVVNDWLSSTKVAIMTNAEAAGYWFLLCHAWNDELCRLPGDDETLARLSRLGADWPKAKSKILACFEPDPVHRGFIFNERQRRTRIAQSERLRLADARCSKMRDAKASLKGSLQDSSKGSLKEPLKALSSPVPRPP